ncbi:GHMP family kinase ATP-binding protein [Halorussus sp. AFM4]|uniref:GHMP family kinase ATP-binding protein n=1 Tax=Halorussus sp. AFM4 TaxID=3421651 RepID=UPI003EBB133A
MEAFAPGSVTAVFAPAGDGDESKGASVAVADGVVADVTPADGRGDEPVVTVAGEPTDFEPVELALAELDVPARADLTAEVPIGRGFGASGAATLATAIAANAEFDLGYSREELVEVAHRAEVEAGTGLGDVFVQDRGGLVVGDGGEPRRYGRETPIEYASFGPIATEEALADEALMARVAREGTAALDALPVDPSLERVVRDAWAFAEAVDLPTDEVREAVAEVEAAGGVASMAMVGETVFAVGVEGVLPNRTAVCPDGAELR